MEERMKMNSGEKYPGTGSGETSETGGMVGVMPQDSYAKRQSAKMLLAIRIHRMEIELHDLKSLHASLPDQMVLGAEEALYKIFCAVHGI